jgi:hypothetical protein
MHEDLKLDEANYFLLRLTETSKRDPTGTRHELSAFLSAARSALQYAYEEAKARGYLPWYETAVSTADPVVKFLTKTRNLNVHERPFSMRTNVAVGIPSGVLSFSNARSIVVATNADGEIVMEWPEMPPHLPPRQVNLIEPTEPSTTTYQYQFKEWPGPEDAFKLCRRYLAEVKRIIDDGRARGILTA